MYNKYIFYIVIGWNCKFYLMCHDQWLNPNVRKPKFFCNERKFAFDWINIYVSKVASNVGRFFKLTKVIYKFLD
jgi:tryptophan-rich sensory protein